MNDKVECRICGKSLHCINGLHLRIHGITTAQYKGQFPDAPMLSLKMCENISKGMQQIGMSDKVKAAWARGDFDSKEYRCKLSKARKASWADPDSGLNSNQRRERLSIGIKAAWEDGKYDSPEVRARMFEATTRAWEEGKYDDKTWFYTESWRDKVREAVKSTYNSERGDEIRRRLSLSAKAAWACEDSGIREYWRNYVPIVGKYPPEFNETFRQMIRARDNYKCAVCRLFGNAVHHIDYVKENTLPENCITLCHSCHSTTNFNRNYWQQELSKLVDIREEMWV